MKKYNNDKGFTLVELCIAMALTAIVVVMCVTYLMIYNRSVKTTGGSASEISEISKAQEMIYNWIKIYDTINYEISVNGTNELQAKRKTGESAGEIHTLAFIGGKIKIDGTETTFESLSKGDFKIGAEPAQAGSEEVSVIASKTPDAKSIVRVTITYGKRENIISLIFPLFSNVERVRYSGDRTMSDVE